MKNLNFKQLFTLVDDILNNRWYGDTSKPIVIWFWNYYDLDAVKWRLHKIRELAGFEGHPIRHNTYMFLNDKKVRVADYPEYAKRFVLPSSFHDYTKGFLNLNYIDPLSPEHQYDCRELIANTGLPLIALVVDGQKNDKVDMNSFVNYRYIGKSLQDWLETATAIDKYGVPELYPCIIDFVTDERNKDLFFCHDDVSDPIDSDPRIFPPDLWFDISDRLRESYRDYHIGLFENKYNTTIELLNGEFGLALSPDASNAEIDAQVNTITDVWKRRLANDLKDYSFYKSLKYVHSNDDMRVYSDIEEYVISGYPEDDLCDLGGFDHNKYNLWTAWLKKRKVERLLEENKLDIYEIKPHSVFLKECCPSEFCENYIFLCNGVVVSTSSLGGLSIRKCDMHLDVPPMNANFYSIAFDVNNNTIKTDAEWNDYSSHQDVGNFEAEVFKELYETIPRLLKFHGIYDYEESDENNVLTLNIKTNIPVKLKKMLDGIDGLDGHDIRNASENDVNDSLSFSSNILNKEITVTIMYEQSELTYSISMIEQEYGYGGIVTNIKESDLTDTLIKFLNGDIEGDYWDCTSDII